MILEIPSPIDWKIHYPLLSRTVATTLFPAKKEVALKVRALHAHDANTTVVKLQFTFFTIHATRFHAARARPSYIVDFFRYVANCVGWRRYCTNGDALIGNKKKVKIPVVIEQNDCVLTDTWCIVPSLTMPLICKVLLRLP